MHPVQTSSRQRLILTEPERIDSMVQKLAQNDSELRTIVINIFFEMTSPKERSQFFFACKKLELYEWKLRSAYSHCKKDQELLVQKVFARDEKMMQAIRRAEQKQRQRQENLDLTTAAFISQPHIASILSPKKRYINHF